MIVAEIEGVIKGITSSDGGRGGRGGGRGGGGVGDFLLRSINSSFSPGLSSFVTLTEGTTFIGPDIGDIGEGPLGDMLPPVLRICDTDMTLPPGECDGE